MSRLISSPERYETAKRDPVNPDAETRQRWAGDDRAWCEVADNLRNVIGICGGRKCRITGCDGPTPNHLPGLLVLPHPLSASRGTLSGEDVSRGRQCHRHVGGSALQVGVQVGNAVGVAAHHLLAEGAVDLLG